jgi:hypothetical protein
MSEDRIYLLSVLSCQAINSIHGRLGSPGTERRAHGARRAMSDVFEERSLLNRLLDEPARRGRSTAPEA